MVFNTGMAMIPGPISFKLVAGILALAGQYGLSCIDEWHDIEFNMNMSRYHFMLVDAYYKHIKSHGW